MDFLFAVRAKRVAKHYINEMIIPVLCAKAGVPAADVRGKITSHRARSTIASQLYNAKEPMTLFELQAWLGHASPETTQHYALHADPSIKERALARTTPLNTRPGRYRASDQLLAFLDSL